MKQAIGDENNPGFILDSSPSRQHPAKLNLWHCDYVDNIALLSNTLEQAQLLLCLRLDCLQSRLDSI